MLLFEWTVALLLGAVILAALARRVGAPYPALLALGGAALALVPGGPRIVLDPELALALFVAPVLLDAAFDASPRDLRENWAPWAASWSSPRPSRPRRSRGRRARSSPGSRGRRPSR
jgi:CPA1 family monovalent cation:H+ antiporter